MCLMTDQGVQDVAYSNLSPLSTERVEIDEKIP